MTAATAFQFDGNTSSLADMLAANADDEYLCYWLQRAVPGDTYPVMGECVVCVAAA